MRFGYDSVAFKFGRCPVVRTIEAGGVGGVVASLYAQLRRVGASLGGTQRLKM